MAVKLLFQGIPQFEDSSGNPYSGARLFFYAAGSSTKQDTYSDSAGSTANSNPIELNAAGYPEVSGNIVAIWGTTGETYKIGLAAPGSDDPPASFIWTIDNVSPINDTTVTVDQWVSGPAPTYVSATSFTLVGDQTSAFHAGRRLKSTNSGGTIYSTIKSSTFGAVTTVTVVNDSGTLDAGLSAVSYGLLSATDPSTPLLSDAYPIASGSSDKTKKLRLELDGFTTDTIRVQTPPDYDHRVMSQTHGADIASPAGGTLDLDTATGDLVDVTGTNTITAITLADGRMATVRFTGALVLTNGASLVLPGAANITTVSGDVAVFRGYSASVVRCVAYQRGSVAPANYIAGLQKLNSGSVSAAATLDIVLTSYVSQFSKYKLVIENFLPATDNVSLLLRFSTNGGSTFNAGASDYGSMRYIRASSDVDGSIGEATTAIIPANGIGNAATEGVSGYFDFFNFTSATRYSSAVGQFMSVTAAGVVQYSTAGGSLAVAQDTDAVRLLFSSGNITSGTWVLYGFN